MVKWRKCLNFNLFVTDALKIQPTRTSLTVKWLRFCASKAEGMGSIPGEETKITHAPWYSQKTKQTNSPHPQTTQQSLSQWWSLIQAS